MVSNAETIAETVGFELLGSNLGRDVESALSSALAEGAIFPEGSESLVIFRKTLAASIADIETHPKGKLFQEFLLKGPYEDSGEIPPEMVKQRLSDSETASAITFIFSHMVNCFKGAVAELLAAQPCARIVKELQRNRVLRSDARLYIGDSVGVHRPGRKGLLKGGDQHILVEDHRLSENGGLIVAGVTEVKSYAPSRSRLCKQLDRHLLRAQHGLRVAGIDYTGEQVRVGQGPDRRVVRISVVPGAWKLPRAFRFEDRETGRMLHVEKARPAHGNQISPVGNDEWHVTLKWSKEALAQAAFEMTFWYMEKVGEVIYREAVPEAWYEMSPAEAGRNAVKMMLYYALLRCRSERESQRAMALYNSYCFGYALGMHFKNVEGRREMLWPEDLDEILATGKTTRGCVLR